MAIQNFLPEVFQRKIQSLETINRNQTIEIEKWKRKNAILHLRLAEALRPSVVGNADCEECLIHKQKDLKFRKKLKQKLLCLTDMVKVFKNELQDLSMDVVKMSKKMDESCQGFKWVLCEKLQDFQVYANDVNDLSFKITQLEESLQLSQELYSKEKERRKELHNALVQVRGNIRVHCRLRPVLEFDHDIDSTEPLMKSDEEASDNLKSPPKSVVHSLSDEVLAISPSPGRPHKLFEFERVYTAQENQQVVFDEIKPLLTSFLDGYNVCIMAYGQTGSGKTHTMLGEKNQLGIVPRAADELFRLFDERNLQDSVQFAVSVAEVYNNDIFDLLSDERRREKHGIVTSEEGSKDVPTLHTVKVETAKEIQTLLEFGLERRAKMSTKVHDHSSRSHLIVSVTATFLHSTDDCRSDCETPNKRPQSAFEYNDFEVTPKRSIRRQLPQLQLPNFSQNLNSPRQHRSFSVPSSPVCSTSNVSSFKTKLQFVDLAGSECVGMSGATGAALRESSYINRSLSALADVLGALSEHRSHIPYRNSKLTHLLQDSIGGDAKMLVLLCVSPTKRYLTETLQCLGFGSRARQIQRGPTKRRIPSTINRPESPNKTGSPRQGRPISSVVRRVLN